MSDHVNNTFKILKYVRIPKSDNAITLFPEFICSLLITAQIFRLVVLPTIKFNNQLATMAGKIGHIIANRDLSPEMPVLGLKKPELLPQSLF